MGSLQLQANVRCPEYQGDFSLEMGGPEALGQGGLLEWPPRSVPSRQAECGGARTAWRARHHGDPRGNQVTWTQHRFTPVLTNAEALLDQWAVSASQSQEMPVQPAGRERSLKTGKLIFRKNRPVKHFSPCPKGKSLRSLA